MYCQKCGATLLDSDRFCPECGAKTVTANPGAANAINRTNMSQTAKPAGEAGVQGFTAGNRQDSTAKVLAGLTMVSGIVHFIYFTIFTIIEMGDMSLIGIFAALMDLIIVVLSFMVYKKDSRIHAGVGMVIAIVNLICCAGLFFNFNGLYEESSARYYDGKTNTFVYYNDDVSMRIMLAELSDYWRVAAIIAAILTVLSVITFLKVKKQKN